MTFPAFSRTYPAVRRTYSLSNLIAGNPMKHRSLTIKTIRSLFLYLGSCLILGSCIATQQDIQALNRQIQMVNAQVYKLEGVRENQADTGAELENIQQEIQRLSGVLEENQYATQQSLETNTAEQEAIRTRLMDLETKVSKLYEHLKLKPEEMPSASSTRGTAVNRTAVSTREQPLALGEDASDDVGKTLYDDTYADFHKGKYEDAINGFKALIAEYPQSDLADNAQFWIGESYMAMKDYKKAIIAYHVVISKYPNGNKAPDAMYRQSLAFLEAGDKTATKLVLKNLIKKYPDSEAGRKAMEKLKSL